MQPYALERKQSNLITSTKNVRQFYPEPWTFARLINQRKQIALKLRRYGRVGPPHECIDRSFNIIVAHLFEKCKKIKEKNCRSFSICFISAYFPYKINNMFSNDFFFTVRNDLHRKIFLAKGSGAVYDTGERIYIFFNNFFSRLFFQ